MKIVVTGANGSVGRQLLAHCAAEAGLEVLALVRSGQAAAALPKAPGIQPRVVSFQDAGELARALQGAGCVVHLAGILVEQRAGDYQSANVEASAALARAARQARVGHMVLVSVIGAEPGSANPYYRSKAEAEQRIRDSGVPATILRTPLLLGPGTAGAAALLGLAARGKVRVLGGGHYRLRPLDVDDLCRAILRLCRQSPPHTGIHELAGPESLSYRQLIERTAARLGKTIRIGSLPVWPARIAAAVGYRLRGGGLSPAVIEVITRDETLSFNADQALGIMLTPLDETLDKLLESH